MNKLALSTLVAVATLAGCAAPDEPRPVSPVISSTGPVTSASGAPVVSSAPPVARTVLVVPAAVLRPGTGVVDAVSAVPMLGTASAGASQPSGASRLAIRMSDGTMQFVDYGDRDISVGQRVELTSDGFIRKI